LAKVGGLDALARRPTDDLGTLALALVNLHDDPVRSLDAYIGARLNLLQERVRQTSFLPVSAEDKLAFVSWHVGLLPT
jgi:hypothetical protein